ncbi:hypothetical protein Leryth_010390 [Lithospermum erythrorhizon]|nr:hypothetical protein Leryth_010390 [Lithospermum erythrorhizon]
MPPKKEVCRNFQRGSCQYGDQCRYLHGAPQQSKPNPFGFGSQNQQQKPNPFGFGSQNQQRKSNPFGFGVQNPQQRGANDSGLNQNKPFENKWTRFSPINNTNNSTPSRSEKQSSAPAPAHMCTDSDSCKRQIAEDFRNEKPMWRLTCYGHVKNGPCDIVGDTSYEELRAAAYDEAKRGMNIQSIIERERISVQAKLVEFESLLSNPYTGPSRLVPNLQNPSQGVSPNTTVNLQSNGGPPAVSSFGQLAASLSSGTSSGAPNTLFGQLNSSQNLNSGPLNGNTSSPSSLFPNVNGNSPFQNLNPGPPNSNPFSQSNPFQNQGGHSSAFGQKSIFPSQSTPPTQQTPFTSNSASVSNGASGAEKNLFSSFPIPPQTSTSVLSQSHNSSSGNTLLPNAIGQPSVNIQLPNSLPRESDGDDSIWMKSKWTIGEFATLFLEWYKPIYSFYSISRAALNLATDCNQRPS